jgi:hypothetical protein
MSKRLWAAVAALVAMGTLAGVAGAEIPRMGDQRVVGFAQCAFLGCPEVTLVANEPFHVDQGWIAPRDALVNPTLRFELSVDGVQRHGAIDLDLALGSKIYVFNFPRGMSGTHSFTGCWYLPDGSLLACGTRIVHFL